MQQKNDKKSVLKKNKTEKIYGEDYINKIYLCKNSIRSQELYDFFNKEGVIIKIYEYCEAE